jgi:acyl carrier protein
MKEKLLELLIDNGLEYEGNNLICEIDSMQYMSLMVGIEEEFDIEFPDIILGQDIFSNFELLYEIVFKLVEEQS